MLFKKSDNKTIQVSDQELLRRFTSSRDPDVLGELYSGYMHLVYGVCLKYFKNRDDAMDGVMQIFEKLIVEIPRQKIENFGSWLHVVTKNYCLMQLRSEKTKQERIQEWINQSTLFMENEPFLHPVDEDSPEMDRMLMDCIEKLKEDQRECIRQFYFGNRCYNEIADNMKTDEKKVKSHLQNAKRNLKICLDRKNETE